MARTGITDRSIASSPTPPTEPRLRMMPTGSGRTLLDGGWWPRSTGPVAELPGLVLAIDAVRGDTAGDLADAAMLMAATAGNLVHAQDIVLAVGTPAARAAERSGGAVWDTEGGRLAPA